MNSRIFSGQEIADILNEHIKYLRLIASHSSEYGLSDNRGIWFRYCPKSERYDEALQINWNSTELINRWEFKWFLTTLLSLPPSVHADILRADSRLVNEFHESKTRRYRARRSIRIPFTLIAHNAALSEVLWEWYFHHLLVKGHPSYMSATYKPLLFIPFDTETYLNFEYPEEVNQYLKLTKEFKAAPSVGKWNIIRDLTIDCGVMSPFLISWSDNDRLAKDINDVSSALFDSGVITFFEYCLDKAQERTVVIYAHNSQYDCQIIFPVLTKHYGNEITTVLKLKKDVKRAAAGILGGLIIYKDYRIWISDNRIYWPVSLEECSGLTEEESDFLKNPVPYSLSLVSVSDDLIEYYDSEAYYYDTFPLADYITYCENDIKMLYRAQKNAFEEIEAIFEVLTGIYADWAWGTEINQKRTVWRHKFKSRASLAQTFVKECLKSRYKRDSFYYDIFRPLAESPEERRFKQLLETSTFGGYTFFNHHHLKYESAPGEYILSGDRVSSYPYELQQVAVGFLCKEANPKWLGKALLFEIRWHKEPTFKAKYSGLSTHLYKNTEFDLSLKQRGYCDQILPAFYINLLYEYYQDINDCIEFLNDKKPWYVELTYLLKPVIKTLFSHKAAYDEEMKKETDLEKKAALAAKRNGVKVIINSIYGKLLQREYGLGTLYYSYIDSFGNVSAIEHRNNEIPLTGRNTLSGAWITWRARYWLLTKVRIAIEEGLTVLGGDTDSIKVGGVRDVFINEGKICTNDVRYLRMAGEDYNTEKIGTLSLELVGEKWLCPKVKKKYLLIPHSSFDKQLQNSWIKKAIAFAGSDLKPVLTHLFIHQYSGDTKESLSFSSLVDMIFSSESAVFLNAKRSSRTLRKYMQKLIRNVDLIFTSDTDPLTAHRIRMKRTSKRSYIAVLDPLGAKGRQE